MEALQPQMPAPICWMPACLNSIIDKKVNNAALSCLETFVDFICTYLWYGYHQFYEQMRLQAAMPSSSQNDSPDHQPAFSPSSQNDPAVTGSTNQPEQPPILETEPVVQPPLPGLIFEKPNLQIFDRTTENPAITIDENHSISINNLQVVYNLSGRMFADGTHILTWLSAEAENQLSAVWNIYDDRIEIAYKEAGALITWSLEETWMRPYKTAQGDQCLRGSSDLSLLEDHWKMPITNMALEANGDTRKALLVSLTKREALPSS